MKRILAVLAAALVAGVLAFCLMRSHKEEGHHSTTLIESMPELAWLRDELDLTGNQFEKVSELHAAYLPKCASMCEQIADAHTRLDTASRGESMITSELKSAISDHAKIHAECQEKMLAHLYETAAVLDEKQATRYLEVMLPYALDFSHSEPDNVHVQ